MSGLGVRQHSHARRVQPRLLGDLYNCINIVGSPIQCNVQAPHLSQLFWRDRVVVVNDVHTRMNPKEFGLLQNQETVIESAVRNNHCIGTLLVLRPGRCAQFAARIVDFRILPPCDCRVSDQGDRKKIRRARLFRQVDKVLRARRGEIRPDDVNCPLEQFVKR
jgi:hypothetical protein